MDIINHTAAWVKGEVLQGRIMVGVGILGSMAFIYFLDFQKDFYKGMLLPFILLQLVLLGYGGYQMYTRPPHLKKIQQSIKVDSEKTIIAEIERVKNDDKVYSWLRPTWAILFTASLLLFYVFKGDFSKGISFGFTILFMAAFISDTFLHHRLKTYLLHL